MITSTSAAAASFLIEYAPVHLVVTHEVFGGCGGHGAKETVRRARSRIETKRV